MNSILTRKKIINLVGLFYKFCFNIVVNLKFFQEWCSVLHGNTRVRVTYSRLLSIKTREKPFEREILSSTSGHS